MWSDVAACDWSVDEREYRIEERFVNAAEMLRLQNVLEDRRQASASGHQGGVLQRCNHTTSLRIWSPGRRSAAL